MRKFALLALILMLLPLAACRQQPEAAPVPVPTAVEEADAAPTDAPAAAPTEAAVEPTAIP